MLDQFGLAPGKADVQNFLGGDASAGNSNAWKSWEKPRGATMVYMIALGGGGGGGGGKTRASGNAGGGGGGGAGCGMSRLIIPALLLPDILWVRPGLGGMGGAADTVGSSGKPSLISFQADSVTPVAGNMVLASISPGSSSSQPGNQGTGAGGGTGGGSDVAFVAADAALMACGIFQSTIGQAGANGGAQTGAAGSAVTIFGTNRVVSGGAGGAGTTSADFSGGAITGSGILNTIAGGTASAPNGNAGFKSFSPFLNTGGSGGAALNNGVGGNGGDGGYGCGGGGGGAGTTGGRGGNGGPGLVVIIAW